MQCEGILSENHQNPNLHVVNNEDGNNTGAESQILNCSAINSQIEIPSLRILPLINNLYRSQLHHNENKTLDDYIRILRIENPDTFCRACQRNIFNYEYVIWENEANMNETEGVHFRHLQPCFPPSNP